MNRSPHRIIAIEDNLADTALLRHALDEYGENYTLEVLPDGRAALEYIHAHCARGNTEPCLIVLDLHLPIYGGAEILRAIRSNPELSHVSVAVLTTSASPNERDEILQIGVSLYRNKPMNWDETVELAGELIEICKNPRAFAAHP